MADDQKSRLGRGLSALLGEEGEDYAAFESRRGVRDVPIEKLSPNANQPRAHFDETAIAELVESIRGHGVLQPLLVRKTSDGGDRFEIIAGERRWRAAQKAGVHSVPVVVKEFSDGEALEAAIIENIQRQDLTPVEEAQAYQRLMTEFGHTQDAVGRIVGKSRSHVANLLRLLHLPGAVRDRLTRGEISMGHARALVTADDPESLARDIVEKGLTVRQAEAFSGRAGQSAGRAKGRRKSGKSADIAALEEDLSAALGLQVAVDHRGDAGGEVRIRYRTLEQLDEICRRLSHGKFH